jgi:hypothetical protein
MWRGCYHIDIAKQREFEVQLERSRAEAAEIVELRKQFLVDMQAASIPADLKKTLADMAADPALLKDMIADKSLLQDVGSDLDSFIDALNQGISWTRCTVAWSLQLRC